MDDRHPLTEVAEHVREEAKASRVAVVFDLDSTLFCVSPRTQHILRQLGHEPDFAQKFEDIAAILRSIEVLPSDYSIRTVFERVQAHFPDELVGTVKDYWRKHFFSSHFLSKDELYPSANEYVTGLHKLGAEILYLTGRNERDMKEGTLRALKDWNFPSFPESRLYMKPKKDDSDEKYKVDVLNRLVHSYDHIWFFENEPVIIEDVRKMIPQVHIVFVDSVHSGKRPSPTGLRSIAPDFRPGLKALDQPAVTQKTK